MKKLIFAVLMLSLVACGAKEEVNESSNKAKNLVVYSTHAESLLESVVLEFEKETGIKVEYINLMGDLADRVLAEKDSPQADLMFGGASSLFDDLAKKDVFEKTNPSWAKDLNSAFKDENGYWYGTIQTPVVIFYNTEMIGFEEAPKDWSELTDERFKDQFVFRDARSSSAKATYSSLLYQFYKNDKIDEGWEFMKALDSNTKSYYSSGSLQFQSIGRKEASVSFAVLSSVIQNQENGLPLAIVDAESGSPIITDAVGVIKNSKNPESAQKFLEFVGSKEVQAKLANQFNRMPTLEEALNDSPEWMKTTKVKAMDVNWEVISEKQSEWMQKWDSEIKSNN